MATLEDIKKSINGVNLSLSFINRQLTSIAYNPPYDLARLGAEVVAPLGRTIEGFGDTIKECDSVIARLEDAKKAIKSMKEALETEIATLNDSKQQLEKDLKEHKPIHEIAGKITGVGEKLSGHETILHNLQQTMRF